MKKLDYDELLARGLITNDDICIVCMQQTSGEIGCVLGLIGLAIFEMFAKTYVLAVNNDAIKLIQIRDSGLFIKQGPTYYKKYITKVTIERKRDRIDLSIFSDDYAERLFTREVFSKVEQKDQLDNLLNLLEKCYPM